MVSAGLALAGFIKAFAPWILAGVTAIVAAIFKASASRHKAAAKRESARAKQAEEVLDMYYTLEDDLKNLDQEQKEDTADVHEKAASSRDYFE